MRNITNTFENVNNRNITNSILTNSLQATLPLELTDDGTDNIISIKGLSALGTSNQYLRMNNAGTGLEFITLNLVDLNSTQTILNKTFQNCTLNYSTNENTFIGTPSANTFIDGILHLNSNNNRAIINLLNNPNHSIYFKTNYFNVANRMSFYEFGKIDFYTGNDLNINQANMPLRFSISHTDIISNVNTTINGSLTSESHNVLKNNDNGLIEIFKSNVDSGNNNGTSKLKFSTSVTTTGDGGGTINTNIVEIGIFDNTTIFRIKNLVNDIELQAQTNINLKKNDDTPINLNFYKGTNYASLVANNALNSNIEIKLPTTAGTIATLNDIPSATIPLSITNNILSLGGLTNFGSSGQVITSTGNGFTYSTPSSLTNSDVILLVRTQCEDISTFAGNALVGFPPTDIGHTSRNLNLTSDLLFLNFVGATFTLSNNSAQKLVVSSTITKVYNLLLVSSTSTSLEANSQFQVDTSGACKAVLKTTGNNQDIELAFVNPSQSGFIKMLASDNSLNFNNFQKYFFRVGSTQSSTQRIAFDSDITTNFNTYSFDIAGNQAIGIDSADYYSNVSNSYDFNIGSNSVLSLSSTKIRHPIETETNKQFYFYKIDNTAFDTANNRGKIYPGNDNELGLISNNVNLRLHAGEVVGQVSSINADNVAIQFYVNQSQRAYMTKTVFVVNNFTQINYNSADSFTKLNSNLPNSKVGFHFYSASINHKLYIDFTTPKLVSTCNRFQIAGTDESIQDSNGRGMIFKTSTGNFVGLNVGNAVDKLNLNFGSVGSVFVNSSGDLKSLTFNSYSWKTSVGELTFQSDRNLVIYNASNSAIFATNTSTSDREKKENIVDLEQNESINVVKQLKTYRYNYIDDIEKIPQIGFMADEIKPLIPECVKTISNNNTVSNLLFKENIIPHLVNTIQSLLSKVELLESRIKLLES